MPENAGDSGETVVPRQDDRDLLDLVDEDGQVIGTASREECHAHPLLAHRAVHVFIRNAAGAIYLQKRSRAKRIQPGKWDTSVGGHLDAGESYEDGAERELLEELGIGLKDAGGRAALKRLHDYVWRNEVETEHVRTFELVSEGPFTLHPAEIDEGRFWTEDELREATGTGKLTPNLEEELRRIGVLAE